MDERRGAVKRRGDSERGDVGVGEIRDESPLCKGCFRDYKQRFENYEKEEKTRLEKKEKREKERVREEK